MENKPSELCVYIYLLFSIASVRVHEHLSNFVYLNLAQCLLIRNTLCYSKGVHNREGESPVVDANVQPNGVSA